MKKPHEQTWTYSEDGTIDNAEGIPIEFYVEANGRLGAAAPDMARALLSIRSRVAEAGTALPRGRDADQMAALEDSFVTIPTAMLRDAFAALRKAGVLPESTGG